MQKKDGLLLKSSSEALHGSPTSHTHTRHDNTTADQWERPMHFIQIHVLCCQSPMIILEINVVFLEQGTNIPIPGKCKQCMQIWNMSLNEAWNTQLGSRVSHGIRKCGLSHQKKKNEKKKRENNNIKPLPLPSTLKAINGTMIKIMITNHMSHLSRQWQIMWYIKSS